MTTGTTALSLRDALATAIERALDAAQIGNREERADALVDLAPVLRNTALLSVISMAGEPTLPVMRPQPGLYVLGHADDSVLAIIDHAFSFATDSIGMRPRLAIVRIVPTACSAKTISEIDDIAIVDVDTDAAANVATMAHEFAHSALSSGHRMLDEGLAEWIGINAASGSAAAARAELERRAAAGPDAATLAARRWTNEPAFESLDAPPGSAHARAALAIADLMADRGREATQALFARVDAEKIEDIRPLLGIPVPGLGDQTGDVAELETIRRNFACGVTEGSAALLAVYRKRTRVHPEDPAIEAAYLRLLVQAAETQPPETWVNELDAALDAHIARHGDTALAFAVSICRDGLRMRAARDFVELNDIFGRVRAIADLAIEHYPEDLDVLSAVAKLEVRTPAEYGGNPKRARNLLIRAAAAAQDPEIARQLRSAAEAFATEPALA